MLSLPSTTLFHKIKTEILRMIYAGFANFEVVLRINEFSG